MGVDVKTPLASIRPNVLVVVVSKVDFIGIGASVGFSESLKRWQFFTSLRNEEQL